ncbi:uncharacterized protein BcabD6B2_57110 [Babesia caballi]|uniref:Membrane protein, putative n=1 Tax=Babesia caballi TaxID=5871 RepID=A0AAV4M337_BABCB|nr:membrane protein, putative [Babesia caballi]
MTDSGLSIKRQIAAATGVPVGLQRLFVSESIWTLGTRTPLGDGDRVSEFHSLMRLRHDTHDLELNVLLELPAPLHHNMRAEAERLDEYVSVLRRYSALLGRVKAAREDPRLLLDPGDSDVGDLRGCDSDSVGTLGDAAGGGMTADGSPGTLGSHGKDGAEDPAKASHVPANTNRHGSETGRKAADNQSGNFVLPNRRRHLLFFHDLPPSEGGAGAAAGGLGDYREVCAHVLPHAGHLQQRALGEHAAALRAPHMPALPDAAGSRAEPQPVSHAAHEGGAQSGDKCAPSARGAAVGVKIVVALPVELVDGVERVLAGGVGDEGEPLGELRLLVLGQVGAVDAAHAAEQLDEVLLAHVLAEVGDPDGVLVEAPAIAALLAARRHVLGGHVPVLHEVEAVAVVAQALELHLELPGGARQVDVRRRVNQVEVVLLVAAVAPADGLLDGDFVLGDHGNTGVVVLFDLEAGHVVSELRSLVGHARDTDLLDALGDLQTS